MRKFVPIPDRCYFEKGKWIERGYHTYINDITIEERIENLECLFDEIHYLFIEIWNHYQPEMSPELREMMDKLMKICRDMAMEDD